MKHFDKIFTLIILLGFTAGLQAQTLGPEVTSWILNQGETGQYYMQGNSTPQNSGHLANVQQVQYSTNNVYVTTTGIPGYAIGPYLDGNPAQAGAQTYLFRIPRNPQQNTGTLTSTGLGHIGVLSNGVPIYNASDAMSYNNQGIWNRNAVAMENDGFDCSKGHPAPNMQNVNSSYYHHHQNPIAFNVSANPTSTVCDMYPSDGLYTPSAAQHSPIIGYAFDGYPIYGSYGYDDPNDAGSSIRRIVSGYEKRAITQRTTLPDGTVLQANQYGPAVDATWPLGSFIEDYAFTGNGDLDEHNGRFCVTPEYPQGTYAYFATIETDMNSAYPYFIGPEYYGVVATDNFPTPGPGGSLTNVSIGEPVTTWDGSVAVEQAGGGQVVDVYPIPVADVLRIRGDYFESTVTVQVSDLTGHVMRTEQAGSGSFEIALDMQPFAAGVYLVHVQSDNYQLVKRVVKH